MPLNINLNQFSPCLLEFPWAPRLSPQRPACTVYHGLRINDLHEHLNFSTFLPLQHCFIGPCYPCSKCQNDLWVWHDRTSYDQRHQWCEQSNTAVAEPNKHLSLVTWLDSVKARAMYKSPFKRWQVQPDLAIMAFIRLQFTCLLRPSTRHAWQHTFSIRTRECTSNICIELPSLMGSPYTCFSWKTGLFSLIPLWLPHTSMTNHDKPCLNMPKFAISITGFSGCLGLKLSKFLRGFRFRFATGIANSVARRWLVRWSWSQVTCQSSLSCFHGWFLMCAMVKSRYIGDGHPTFNRNPCNGYINPY